MLKSRRSPTKSPNLIAGGPLRLEQVPRGEPFSAVVRVDAGGRVIEEHFGP
jgi:hypothetical protein